MEQKNKQNKSPLGHIAINLFKYHAICNRPVKSELDPIRMAGAIYTQQLQQQAQAKAEEQAQAQHARIAELESQLEAIGAGGVEPLRKPVQAVEPELVVEMSRKIAELQDQLIAEAARTAEQKLRADQLEKQHSMQSKMHAQASAQLAAPQAVQDAVPATNHSETPNSSAIIVPYGWKLVPDGATPDWVANLEALPDWREAVGECIKRFLAAAPAHPAKGVPDEILDALGMTGGEVDDVVARIQDISAERHDAEEAHAALAATQQGLDAPTEAARSVLAERARQIAAEGYTPEQDDGYNPGVLALHGGLYACHAYDNLTKKRAPEGWQWDAKWWKSKDPRSNLVRAGALILAEIERMDRSFAAQAKQGEQANA